MVFSGTGMRHRMVADLRLDAVDRARHVALDAGTARARRRVMGVRRDRFADALDGSACRAHWRRGEAADYVSISVSCACTWQSTHVALPFR